MLFKFIAAAAAGCFLALSVGAAKANTIYSYTGVHFTDFGRGLVGFADYTTSMNVFGSFTLATSLAPGLTNVDITADLTSFSFFDGINTLTDLNTSGGNKTFSVSTDVLGKISAWGIIMQTGISDTGISFRIRTRFDGVGAADDGQIKQCTNYSGGSSCTNGFTSNFGLALDPGTWAVADVPGVPIPAALPLFATGLAGLGFLVRRKRKQTA
jgi:hypothetical protein